MEKCNVADGRDLQYLIELAKSQGASNAAVIGVEMIQFDPEFRVACEANRCGNYNKNWKCPPDVGNILELIEIAKSYKYGLILQSIGKLKSKFDFKGMLAAGSEHQNMTARITEKMREEGIGVLPLGVGHCSTCASCNKLQNLSCAFPDKAMASIESYGMDVMKLAKMCNMNYNNGENTTTVFGACLFNI